MSIMDQKVSVQDVGNIVTGFSLALECVVASLKRQPGFDEKNFNESLQLALEIPTLPDITRALITKLQTEKVSPPTDL